MPGAHLSWADSSERAHTVMKCSLVKDIIQHVDYPALTARVKKIAQQAIAHLRKQPVVISKNFNKGALGTTTPIVWVLPSYNHAHVFKDGNMII